MSNNRRKEIECIARLQQLGSNTDNILSYLLNESLISNNDIQIIRRSPDSYKDIQALLSKLSTSGKLQLLEYEWTVLPVERIKIHIVTDKSSEEFTYNF
jgi:hypothetical protein